MKTIITGATGLVGSALFRRLDSPVGLVRRPEAARARFAGGAFIPWSSEDIPRAAVFEDVGAVVHLAGETINGRWTADKKRRIRQSRVEGTRNLVAAISSLETPPSLLVTASAVDYYGDRGAVRLDETAPPGSGFLSSVCSDWEAAAAAGNAAGVRVVPIRFGLVLSPDGGAFEALATPHRLGLGGPLGSGDQYVSWIHIDDLVALIIHIIAHPEISGPVNGVAPTPVTNATLSKTLSRLLRRPNWVRVPGPVLRLGLGEMTEMLLASKRVVPRKAVSTGFRFRFETIDAAMADCLGLER